MAEEKQGRGGVVHQQRRTEAEMFFTKGRSRVNIYLINVQQLTLDKKIEIERITSENGECINIVAVVETQMKYGKMDWLKGIQMVDKMRKEQDKKGEDC